MRQRELSIWLRGLTIVVGVFLLIACIFLAPVIAQEAQLALPEHQGAAWWGTLAFLYVTALVGAVALIEAFLIFRDIGRDRSFTQVNASRLRTISALALLDTVLYVAVFCLMAALKVLSPGSIVLLGAVILFGAAASAAAAALSHLTVKAANIQDDNDLTI